MTEKDRATGPDVPDDFFKPTPIQPYGSAMASFEAAFSIGENFTVRPTVYAGWNSVDDSQMNIRHAVVVGGFLANRYVERQIPFFGFANGFRSTDNLTFVPQLDLRYRFLRKNYLTARAGMFIRDETLQDVWHVYPIWAFGGEYSRQSVAGPLRLAVQWCSITGLTAYASIGIDF